MCSLVKRTHSWKLLKPNGGFFMYKETILAISDAALTKSKLSANRIWAYLVHSAMAGAYVGLGIILIFAFGTPLSKAQSPAVGLVMASTFGIALSLVIIAGSDLFTGNTMVMPLGALSGKVRWRDVARVLFYSYIGNLLGSVFLAYCVYQAGTFKLDPSWVMTVAEKKMNAPFEALFFKAMLCNWLVVLAVWSAYRVKTESAKLIMIWWCLLGFIGSGYEHSVANMTLLSLANFLNDGTNAGISWSGFFYNLVPVTLGNFVSGALFMGVAYYFVSPVQAPQVVTEENIIPQKKLA